MPKHTIPRIDIGSRPGEDEKRLLSHLEDLKKESERSKKDHVDSTELDEDLALYRSQIKASGSHYFELNFVRPFIDSMVAQLTQNRPIIRIEPRQVDLKRAAVALQRISLALWDEAEMQRQLYKMAHSSAVTRSAGLFIGNHGRTFGMSDETRRYQDVFWELIDEVLNAVLFVLIGLEVLILEWRPVYLLIGLLAIPLVLVVRFVCVGLPISALRTIREFGPATVRLMTWGGIRGGISIALALSIPASPHRGLILVVTYTVVVFSVLVQGLTVGRAVRWALR